MSSSSAAAHRFRIGLGRLAAVAAIVLGVAVASIPRAGAASNDYLIVAGDAASNSLIAYDPSVTDWTSPQAVKWTWGPTTAEGFTSTEIADFTCCGGFKLRNSPNGQEVVFATGSGLVGIITAPPSGGKKVWTTIVPVADNAHSAELLPNGDLAVTATGNDNSSDHGWVRVYAASQGQGDNTYASYALYDSHEAWWDPTIQRLWVIGREGPLDPTTGQPTGDRVLTALAVTGSPAQPHLTQDLHWRVVLPDVGEHDVNIDPNDPNVLLLTTANHTYSYNRLTGTFTTLSNLVFVKAISEQPSGQLVQTQADEYKTPPGDCKVDDWCTDTVNFFNPTYNRTVPGAQFYRAYVWNPNYSAIGDTTSGPVDDRTLGSSGWSASTQIDANPAITTTAAAALPNGVLHAFTLVPGSGVYDRTLTSTGWSGSATQIDYNGAITAIAAAALPNGTLHLFTLLPGSGVWDRTLTSSGWSGSATKIDSNGSITAIAAAALPNGTLHLQTLVPGAGVWDRALTSSGWSPSASQIDTDCSTAGQSIPCITSIASAGLPDGTLHVETLVPTSGVLDLTRNTAGQWSAPTQIDANGAITSIAASATPSGTLHVETVVPDAGVWDRTLPSGGSWSYASQVDSNSAIFSVNSAVLPNGVLHLGTQAYP